MVDRRVSLGSVVATTLVIVATVALAVPVVGHVSGRWRLLPILSGSMAPRIPTGSLVLATPQPASAVRVGDVIIFRAPVAGHRLIAHRVVAVLEHGPRPIVQTKGDANSARDPWQARTDGGPIWTVRSEVPLLGYVTVFTQRSWPFLVLVLGIAALAIRGLRRIWVPGHATAEA
jgi:signal peptidase I